MRRAQRLPLEELQPYLLEVPPSHAVDLLEQKPEPLDWRAVFGNDGPVEVEVGFGKGLFLVSAAQINPGTNYLGIEIERKYQLFTGNRLAKHNLGNVRLACGDARVFLRDHLAGQSVHAVHVYFPDPWWKKRHRKRRLFTALFAGECVRVLRPGGKLLVVSDVAEYFAEIQKQLAGQPQLRQMPPAELKMPEHDLDYLTHFERKYRLEDRPIHRAAYLRAGECASST